MKKSNWIYLFLILLLSVLGFLYALKTANSFKWVSLNPTWVMVVLFLLFLWWFFESISMITILRASGIHIRFSIVFKSMLVGFFFGSMTPFTTGAVPAIILYLKRQNIPVKDCLSPVLMKSLLNGLARALASLLLAIYLKPVLSSKMGLIIQSILILYGTFILVMYFILINKSRLACWFRTILYRILLFTGKKIRFLTFIFTYIGDSIIKSPDRFSCLDHPFRWLPKSFSFIILFWCTQLSLPFFILLSMGIRSNFFHTVSTQASFYLLQPYLPTPGGSGMAEIGYTLISKSLGGLNNPQFIFLWRFTSFYIPLAGGAFFFISNLAKKKNNS